MLRIGDQGNDVKIVQYTLQILGYSPGELDGIFGEITQNAVKEFEKDYDLSINGVVGPETYSRLFPYLEGYIEHYMQAGDTLESLAKKYNTTALAIETANPGLSFIREALGTKIIIPYKFDLIKVKIPYTFGVMAYDIEGLRVRYPFIKVDTIGDSVLGNNIFRIRLGEGENKVTFNASHHANEWITTPLLLKWTEDFLKAFSRNTTVKGYNPREIWKKSTIDIIPMVNPDGVGLVINGTKGLGERAEQLLLWNYGNEDFNDWKANINGVDLNKNYNAAWAEYKELEKEIGIIGPAPALYSGKVPESQPEVKAMVNLTKSEDYRLALAYHTSGQVILWNFKDLQPPESKSIGEEFAKVSGYSLAQPALYEAYAGYKDWFIQEFRKPGYTIKCGKGKSPLPLAEFEKIYENNQELLFLASII